MKIVIETHTETEEQIKTLVETLREQGWDIQMNNFVHVEGIEQEEEIRECNHSYVNGMCTKCYWLEV